jgi:hypothetical protein
MRLVHQFEAQPHRVGGGLARIARQALRRMREQFGANLGRGDQAFGKNLREARREMAQQCY